MTDNKETAQQDSTATEPAANPPASTQNPENASPGTSAPGGSAASVATAPVPSKAATTNARAGVGKGVMTLLLLTFLLALAGVGGAGWLWHQQRLAQEAQQAQFKSLQHDMLTAEQKRSTLVSQITKLTRSLTEQAQLGRELSQQENHLKSRVTYVEQQLVDLTGRQRIDWILKEVEHFVRLAERRLSLLNDVDGALALLTEADQMVREMGEPAARPLREALIDDIGHLRQASIAQVDIDGIFLRLQAVGKHIPHLQRDALVYRIKMEEKENLEDDVPTSGWPYFVHRMQEFVSSMVVVQRVPRRRHTPLLLTDQQIYLQQTLVILLDQAQLALLKGDTEIYRNSINAAITRVQEYLRVDADRTTALIEDLTELSKLTIHTDVPEITGSIRAVQAFRDFWQAEKIERQAVQAAMKERAVELRAAQQRAAEAAGAPEADAAAETPEEGGTEAAQ